MPNALSILILLVQLATTFFVMIGIYMFLALWSYQGGIDGFLGMTIFQPIAAVISTIFTILCCIILGLPIRAIKVVNTWWKRHTAIAWTGLIGGFVLLVLSLTPVLAQNQLIELDGVKTLIEVPHPSSIFAWFAIAFCLLHLFPPANFQNRLGTLLQRFSA